MRGAQFTEKIYEILKNYLNTQNITPNMSLRDDLGLDSMDMAELSMKFEDVFDIIPETTDEISLDNVKTVHELVEAVIIAISARVQQKEKQTLKIQSVS